MYRIHPVTLGGDVVVEKDDVVAALEAATQFRPGYVIAAYPDSSHGLIIAAAPSAGSRAFTVPNPLTARPGQWLAVGGNEFASVGRTPGGGFVVEAPGAGVQAIPALVPELPTVLETARAIAPYLGLGEDMTVQVVAKLAATGTVTT